MYYVAAGGPSRKFRAMRRLTTIDWTSRAALHQSENPARICAHSQWRTTRRESPHSRFVECGPRRDSPAPRF